MGRGSTEEQNGEQNEGIVKRNKVGCEHEDKSWAAVQRGRSMSSAPSCNGRSANERRSSSAKYLSRSESREALSSLRHASQKFTRKDG
ncbi:hypothetical protein RIB2604_02502800 [Aspergillus luchuensis]|uniref:Uncharacterized protein n=1 Tax=Aspergillus kawachii TaxID=1069201 RepID=A0A146FT77_ASPKA|nr:hypothetical protein RIB2604_02502800 [Aspergillus luchuensis]